MGAGFRASLNNTVPADQAIIDKWLNQQRKIGLTVALTALQCQELHRLGYDPEDLRNGSEPAVGGTAGTANDEDPANPGAFLDGFANIATRSKYGT